MIAEIHNKISKTYSNLSERLEDNLTGNFFGTLRYFNNNNVLIEILKKIKTNDSALETNLNNVITTNDKLGYFFWKKNAAYGEIDLLIIGKKFYMGIEIKYHSGLSSDDELKNISDSDFGESNNQLAKYSRMINDSKKNKYGILIFIAPSSIGVRIYNDVICRKIISPEVAFGYISWEDIYKVILTLDENNFEVNENIMIGDLVKYLEIKGFGSFNGFLLNQSKALSQKHYCFIETINLFNDIKCLIREDGYYGYKCTR
jgi:hypothetical protein